MKRKETRITIRIEDDLKDRIENYAKKFEIPFSACVRGLILSGLSLDTGDGFYITRGDLAMSEALDRYTALTRIRHFVDQMESIEESSKKFVRLYRSEIAAAEKHIDEVGKHYKPKPDEIEKSVGE